MDSQQIDPILFPFLEATEEEEGGPLLRLFAEHVNPTAERVLASKRRLYEWGARRPEADQDRDEIYRDVQLSLLGRLRDLKADPARHPISNLRSYVATAAHNAYDEHLRRRHPRRRSLKDKLRYHLVNEPGLALWEDADAGWIAALNSRRADGPRRVAASNPQSIRDLIDRTRAELRPADPQAAGLPDVIRAILVAAGSPVPFDAVISVVAQLRQIYDHPAESIDEEDGPSAAPLVSTLSDPESLAERHQLIQRLWDEICRLPRRHRVALLFNLRSESGVNVITLLPSTGVATVEQIAAALEIPDSEFETIWPDLPMDDLAIAAYLGATRQQVINLRKSARGRLHRVLKALEARGGGRPSTPAGRLRPLAAERL